MKTVQFAAGMLAGIRIEKQPPLTRWAVVTFIASKRRAQTRAQLCNGMRESTFGGALDSLTHQGFLRRVPDAVPARWGLTKKGEAEAAKVLSWGMSKEVAK